MIKHAGSTLLSKLNPRETSNIQEGYTHGRKYGFFNMKVNFMKSLFGQMQYKQYFFVLSDIGLVCLRNPQDDEPKLIVPVVGAKLLVDPRKLSKKYSFILEANHKEHAFYCNSREEQ